jgi:hypothetical protein
MRMLATTQLRIPSEGDLAPMSRSDTSPKSGLQPVRTLKQLMPYLGLPSEHSSGGARRQEKAAINSNTTYSSAAWLLSLTRYPDADVQAHIIQSESAATRQTYERKTEGC